MILLKLILTFLLIVVTVLIPLGAYWTLIGVAAVLFTASLLAGVSPKAFFKRIASVEPFVIGVALLSLFSRNGFSAFFFMVTKSTLCVVCLILFSMTSRLTDILQTLRTIRVHGFLLTTFALMYRYVFVLTDEAGRMRRARTARTYVTGRRREWNAMASIAGQLFVRSSERAERIFRAMCARGWRT